MSKEGKPSGIESIVTCGYVVVIGVLKLGLIPADPSLDSVSLIRIDGPPPFVL